MVYLIDMKNKINILFSKRPSLDIDAFFLLYNSSFKISRILGENNELSNLDIKEIKHTVQKRKLNKLIIGIVKHNYTHDKSQIADNLNSIKRKWRKTENIFYKLTYKIYKDFDIKERDFIAHPSMWAINIRDLRKKRLSFPYNGSVNEAVFVIAHELLHIIFFDYLQDRYFDKMKHSDDNKIWALSEVVNVLIQSQKEWVRIFKLKPRPYKEHAKLYKRLKTIWNKSHDIDEVITTAIKI